MLRIRTLSLIASCLGLLLVGSPDACGQTSPTIPAGATAPTGEKTLDVWKWTPAAAHHDSVVEVSTSGGTGTGVLIQIDPAKPYKDGHEGLVLTAWHVIQDDIVDSKIKVTYRNGRRSKGCRVVEYDEDKDVALVWVWAPDSVKPAKLAKRAIGRGDWVEMIGLGGGTKLTETVRSFEAIASDPSTLQKIYADASLLPGDSGGPVFNQQHEVVGIISGGWFWWGEGSTRRPTWPARASNLSPINSLLGRVQQKRSVAQTADPAVKVR